jgi:hypothetical protein
MILKFLHKLAPGNFPVLITCHFDPAPTDQSSPKGHTFALAFLMVYLFIYLNSGFCEAGTLPLEPCSQSNFFFFKLKLRQAWWDTSVIPATWVVELGGLGSEASLGKSMST